MSEEKQHGLCIKEQTLALWAICRWNNNPEACPANLLGDLNECPFGCKCEDIQPKMWGEFLKNREAPFKEFRKDSCAEASK